MTFFRVFCLSVCFGAFWGAAFGSGGAGLADRDLPGERLSRSPLVDGRIDEGEWSGAARGSGFVDFDTNLASDEEAEFWLGYTPEGIYFAGRVRTDPGRVVRGETRPNASLRGNDNFTLALDPFGQGRNFNSFSANSNGAWSINLAGGRAAKTEWLGEILTEGRLTDTGWEVEMRIPWSVMVLPPAGERDLRFNVRWFRSNKQNTYTYVFTNQRSELNPVWRGVEVPVAARGRVLNLLPYVFGGVQEGSGPLFNSGLDFKTSLTDTIQAVGTINPDFRNIESSILSLDFSYFERLANETRPFFQEGSEFLRTGFDQRLFASQRLRTLDAGLNVYGQVGDKVSFGSLVAGRVGEQSVGVFSAEYEPNSRDSFVGAFVGNEERGRRNRAGMFNYFSRSGLFNWYSTNQYTDDQARGSGYRGSLGAGYRVRSFEAGVDFSHVDPGFFPRLGFSPERDFREMSFFASQDITPSQGEVLQYSWFVSGSTADRLSGAFYRDSINSGFDVRTKSGVGVGFNAQFSRFEGNSDRLFSGEVEYPANDPYRGAEVEFSTGSFAGRDYQSIEFDWRWRFLGTLQLTGRSQFVEFERSQTQHVFSLNYDLNRFESVGGRAVVEDGELNWYLSYRLGGRRGAEYFVLLGDPRAESFQNRFVFKAVIPVTVRY